MKLGILVAVFALCAIGAANASAATSFTASATGSLTGHALETQKFSTAAGTVECKKADISGTISSTASTEQEAEVEYTECSAFGFSASVSKAKYLFTANGTVHVLANVAITIDVPFILHCTITVTGGAAIWYSTVSYTNVNTSKVKVTPTVTGIAYHVTYQLGSSGCGSAGEHSDGTYSGASEIERVGGGSVSVD